jgi:iron transport multicopper oxidase
MLSSLRKSALLGVAALLAASANADIVTYDFNIGWTLGNPDGAMERPVIGINGKWPPPVMYAMKGDQVVVNVANQLGNQSTALHFHGIFQSNTTNMDGAVGATQCAIPAGSSMTYNFTVCSFFYLFGFLRHTVMRLFDKFPFHE